MALNIWLLLVVALAVQLVVVVAAVLADIEQQVHLY
jgi:hypothetical protein